MVQRLRLAPIGWLLPEGAPLTFGDPGSASGDALQTKVLSALYFNNLVYMTVTIALLGFGTSGVVVSVLQRKLGNPERLAAFCAAGLAVSIILCIYLASSLPGAFPFILAAPKMLVTTIFSALGMVMPLAIFEREGVRIAREWGLVSFFSSLGVGFMFVEVGCMQWLSLYLGHPMYSLMVVLAALLFYAGLGSLAAGRWDFVLLPKLRLGMFGTAVLIPVWLIAMKYLMPLTERWALGGRISVVLASLLPLGLAMGVPFATGLRYLADHHPRFIPWAWGINGLTSVAASILAVVLAMRIGFTAVVLLGSLVYIAGYAHLLCPFNRRQPV